MHVWPDVDPELPMAQSNLMINVKAADPRDWRKWLVYQRERFPLLAHGPLVAAFSFSAVTLSSVLRGAESLPSIGQYIGAFIGSLGFFMLLRLADEFKDNAEDTKYRPYRAVPRGLVTLAELRTIAFVIMGIQLLVSLILEPRLLGPLLLTWAYLWLMYREFFVPAWLKSHPFTYMWTHMLIMPLIDIYTSACDWMVVGTTVPPGLKWFLLASFFNGMVIEIGRKIRAPEQEEAGVDSYTHLWGIPLAMGAWLLAQLLTLLTALPAAHAVSSLTPFAVGMGFMLFISAQQSYYFFKTPTPKLAKFFEVQSGAWTLGLYLGLGLLSLTMREYVT